MAPKKTISTREVLKPKACATNPIMGGPTKKPVKPTLLTAESATAGGIALLFAASIYTIGITEDTPKPTRANPMITQTGY